MNKWILFGTVIVFLILPRIAFCQTIQEIFLEGNRRIDQEVIWTAMSSKVNDPVSSDRLNEDLKAIYALGYFQDVKIFFEEINGKIQIRVIVIERRTIRGVKISGNSKIETEDLEKEIDLPIFSIFEPQKVNENVHKLKKFYDKEGYYLVDIKLKIEEVGDDGVSVTFEISENRQVKIRKINILGNNKLSDRKIRKFMATKEGNLLSFLTKAGRFDWEVLSVDVQKIIYLYQDHGYLDIKVGEPEAHLSVNKKHLFINIYVQEGEKYRIGELDVSGDLIFPKEDLKNSLKLKKGEIFRRSILEKDVQTLTQKYSDEGYFYVNVRPLDKRDSDLRKADVNFSIEKGFKVYFERINITGNSITRDKVIRREIKVVEGDLFHFTKLRKSLAGIKRLGFFDEVIPSTPRGSEDNKINLNVEVKEKPTGTFTIGAGFSSVDKFLFNAEISKDNFLGLGLKGSISAQLSGTRQLFNISVNEPHFLDSPWRVGVSAFRSDVGLPDFDRNALGFQLLFGRNIWELFEGRIAYRFEKVSISDVDPAIQSFFEDGITSAVTLFLIRDGRDNRIFPKKGTFNSLSLELAGGPMGGENEFFRARWNGRIFYPIYRDIIFRTQLRLGFIGSITGEPVPIFERFFIGGINSIRGYASRSIGPTRQVVSSDPASPDFEFSIGGNKEFVFNTEIGFPLVPPVNIRGVIFFDAGNAFDDDEAIDITNLRTSFGGGIRWYSPLGPLRFEFGFPINPRPGDEKSAFEFTIGTSF